MVEKKSCKQTENSTTPELTSLAEFIVYKDTENLLSNGRNGRMKKHV